MEGWSDQAGRWHERGLLSSMHVSGVTALEHCKGLLDHLERCDMLGRFVVSAGMTVVVRGIVVGFTVSEHCTHG